MAIGVEYGKLRVLSGTISDLPLVKRLYGQLSEDVSQVERDYMSIVNDPNSRCLILECGLDQVGMVILHLKSSLSLGRSMDISEIVIDENHRNMGLGSFLMKHCMCMAKEMKVDSIALTCALTNGSLHRFYENLGFSCRMRQYSFIPQIDESES